MIRKLDKGVRDAEYLPVYLVAIMVVLAGVVLILFSA